MPSIMRGGMGRRVHSELGRPPDNWLRGDWTRSHPGNGIAKSKCRAQSPRTLDRAFKGFAAKGYTLCSHVEPTTWILRSFPTSTFSQRATQPDDCRQTFNTIEVGLDMKDSEEYTSKWTSQYHSQIAQRLPICRYPRTAGVYPVYLLIHTTVPRSILACNAVQAALQPRT